MARRILENNEENLKMNESFLDLDTEDSATSSAYHELSDIPVQEVPLLTQVQRQVDLLEEMIFRNSFLMKEVRYLLKK